MIDSRASLVRILEDLEAADWVPTSRFDTFAFACLTLASLLESHNRAPFLSGLELAAILAVLMARPELGEDALAAWALALASATPFHFADMERYAKAVNVGNCLRCLYFYAEKADSGGVLAARLSHIIRDLMRIR